MVNEQLVSARLQALEGYVDVLRDLQKYDVQALRANLEHRWSVERGLEISAECVLDIGGHVVASDKLGRPADYTEVLDLLGENNVVPKGFAREIRGLAGFRNLLPRSSRSSWGMFDGTWRRRQSRNHRLRREPTRRSPGAMRPAARFLLAVAPTA